MPCKPVLNGVLWNLRGAQEENHMDMEARWKTTFAEMKHLGLSKIMLHTGISQAQEAALNHGVDLIETIAAGCDRHNMEMIISTGIHPRWSPDLKMTDLMKSMGDSIDKIHFRYGAHPCFKGWYIDMELPVVYGEKRKFQRDVYRETVLLCKETTPKLPVVVSPYFTPPTETDIMHYGNHDPEEFHDYWSDMISCCHFDIIALQDNGGQHLSYFDRSITEPYIEAFARACSENGCRFWGNVETGEFHIGSAREFTDIFGPDGDVNFVDAEERKKRWRAVPIERLKEKLELMSQYSELNLSWGYQPFYHPAKGAAAAKAYRDYESYLMEFYPEMIDA